MDLVQLSPAAPSGRRHAARARTASSSRICASTRWSGRLSRPSTSAPGGVAMRGQAAAADAEACSLQVPIYGCWPDLPSPRRSRTPASMRIRLGASPDRSSGFPVDAVKSATAPVSLACCDVSLVASWFMGRSSGMYFRAATSPLTRILPTRRKPSSPRRFSAGPAPSGAPTLARSTSSLVGIRARCSSLLMTSAPAHSWQVRGRLSYTQAVPGSLTDQRFLQVFAQTPGCWKNHRCGARG
jgi:hypothetical protein